MANMFDRVLKQPVLPLLRFGYQHAHEHLSYHLPAFYELWGGVISGLTHHNQALDRHFWLDAAQESRAFFNRMMHPITGLNPDYSEFSGVAKGDAWKDTCMHDDFCYDTWCTAVNWAVNYAWWKC